MFKQRPRTLYILQILIGCAVISVFNPANTGWQFSLIAIPTGLFLIVAASYGISHNVQFSELPRWVRAIDLLGIVGFCIAFLLIIGLRLLFLNFTF